MEEMKGAESIKVEKPELMTKEKKEAVTGILKDIDKELGGNDEDMLGKIIKEVLNDRRLGRDDHLRKHEQDWFELIFAVLNEPKTRLRENKETIAELIAFQRKNHLETQDLFYSTKTYVYLKYLLNVLEHLKDIYLESYELVRDEVRLLLKAYDDTTMSTRSLDISFDTKFEQEPMESAYQQLRKAGMLQLQLPNSLNAKFAFQAR